jgi:hypothetical protein
MDLLEHQLNALRPAFHNSSLPLRAGCSLTWHVNRKRNEFRVLPSVHRAVYDASEPDQTDIVLPIGEYFSEGTIAEAVIVRDAHPRCLSLFSDPSALRHDVDRLSLVFRSPNPLLSSSSQERTADKLDRALHMMLLANSAIISEAAGPSAWKGTSEPNSWQFSDLWSAFPEFANSIFIWARSSGRMPGKHNPQEQTG